MVLAMYEKDCETKALLRSIRADIVNYSGVVSKLYNDRDIQPIPIIDNANMIMPIKNIKQALGLLKQFKQHG